MVSRHFCDRLYTYVRGCTDTVGQTVKLTTWLCAHVCSLPVCTALRGRVRFLLAELRLISFRLYVPSPLSIRAPWLDLEHAAINSPITRFLPPHFSLISDSGYFLPWPHPARVQLSCSFANLCEGFALDRFER